MFRERRETSYGMTLKTKTTHKSHRNKQLEQVESTRSRVSCWEWTLLEAQMRIRKVRIRAGMQAIIVGMAEMDSDELIAAIIIYDANDASCRLTECWLLHFVVETNKMWHFYHVWTASLIDYVIRSWMLVARSLNRTQLRFVIVFRSRNVFRLRALICASNRNRKLALLEQQHNGTDSCECLFFSAPNTLWLATREIENDGDADDTHAAPTFFHRFNCSCTSHILLSDLHSIALSDSLVCHNWNANLVICARRRQPVHSNAHDLRRFRWGIVDEIKMKNGKKQTNRICSRILIPFLILVFRRHRIENGTGCMHGAAERIANSTRVTTDNWHWNRKYNLFYCL